MKRIKMIAQNNKNEIVDIKFAQVNINDENDIQLTLFAEAGRIFAKDNIMIPSFSKDNQGRDMILIHGMNERYIGQVIYKIERQ